MAIKKIQLQYTAFDLQFDENKPWTEDDTALINATETLICFEIKKGKDFDDKFYAFANFKKQMQFVAAEFDELKESIKDLITQVDDFEFELVGFTETKIDRLNNLFNERGTLLDRFHIHLTELEKAIAAICLIKEGEEQEEDGDLEFEPEWKAYDEIKAAHFNNWENQSIDISSFDDLEERMYANFDVLEKRNQNTKFYINDITLSYNIFIAKIEGTYQVWEELQKRIVLLNRFVNSSDSIDKIQKLN